MKPYKITARDIAHRINDVTCWIPRPDGSLPNEWSELSDEQQNHAINAVKEIYNSEPKTAEELHELWMKPLLATSWKTGEYNIIKRTHPCLMPFNELPDSEKLKDILWQKMTEAFRNFHEE